MASNQSKPRRPGRLIVGVLLLLIALVAVYAARGTSGRSERSAIERKQPQPVMSEQKRLEAAQVMTCTAIQKTVEASLVFDRAFSITPQDDGTSYLTTAALLNGRQVDVSAVLQWDAERQAWELLEARLGGAAVPLNRGQRDEGQ